jgi:putative hydrolase of the HAD superfamily
MNTSFPINTLFLDIGGVLLTNGWGRGSRKSACEHFNLDFTEVEERHHLSYSIYEEGKLNLEDYLEQVVFFQMRSFTMEEFRDFMFLQSTPFEEMISMVKSLKAKYKLKIAVVNNEGRELNNYRVLKFGLNEFVDFFISSCYIHVRKPDADIYRIALDVAQVLPRNVVYLEDRDLFVDIAGNLGINAIHHKDYQSTCMELAKLGLVRDSRLGMADW